MATLDLEAILARIEEGDSQAEIARDLGVSASVLSGFLNREENAERSARARQASAEAWLDKGLAVISSSLPRRGDVDPAAARAYAQECARRAAIRNPAYRDKVDQTVSGPNGGPIKTESTVTLTAEEAYKRMLGGV
jgi:transcriptional regulator with XRE-family HTH domain